MRKDGSREGVLKPRRDSSPISNRRLRTQLDHFEGKGEGDRQRGLQQAIGPTSIKMVSRRLDGKAADMPVNLGPGNTNWM